MIHQQEWQEWLEHPVTEQFFKYLKDSVKDEADDLAERIRGGAILSESEQVSASTVYQTLDRIAEIDLQELTDFYNEE